MVVRFSIYPLYTSLCGEPQNPCHVSQSKQSASVPRTKRDEERLRVVVVTKLGVHAWLHWATVCVTSVCDVAM